MEFKPWHTFNEQCFEDDELLKKTWGVNFGVIKISPISRGKKLNGLPCEFEAVNIVGLFRHNLGRCKINGEPLKKNKR